MLALKKTGLDIIKKESKKDDRFILAVDYVFSTNLRATIVNRNSCQIDSNATYLLLPQAIKIKIKQISNQPMTFKYKLEEEDMKEEAEEGDEECKIESNEDNNNENDLEISNPSEQIIKRGDLIVSCNADGKPCINTSQRLMVEFSIDTTDSASSIIVTKGYQFDINIHSFSGTATIESLDGTVKYSESGEREFNQAPLKIVKSGEIFVGKMGLSSPIGIDNFDSIPSISQFIGCKDGNYIGCGKVIKHVPI